MKILFLSSVLPHAPVDGDKLRAFHLIRMLSKKHEVTLASFYATEGERRDLSPLKPMVRKMILVRHARAAQYLRAAEGFFSSRPINVSAFDSPKMERLLEGLCRAESFDLVFAYRLRMAPYALRLPARARVLDFTDSLTVFNRGRLEQERDPLKRALWRREERRLEAAEASAALSFDLCLANSSQDAAEITGFSGAGKKRILTLSNGVDFHYYHPSAGKKLQPDSLVFVGNLAYGPNADAALWFAREIFPLIRRIRPMARFNIVGGHPPKTLRKMHGLGGVTVAGFVPDVRPWALSAAAAVCPLRLGAGRQNKVLESMALGVPVVASPLAARGVEAVPGRHLLQAREPKEFAGACLKLMGDPSLRLRLSRQALNWVRKKYRWEDSARILENALRSLPALALALCLVLSGCMKRQVLEDSAPRVSQARAVEKAKTSPVPMEAGEVKTQGDRYYQKGDFTRAVIYLREEVKKNPKDPKLWRHLGSAYGSADDYNNAIFCYRKSISLNPVDLKTYYNISLMLDYTGGFEEAEKLAKQGLKLDPKAPEMHSSLGNILSDKDDEEGALKSYAKALELKPDDPITRFNKGSLHFKRHESGSAEEEYRKVLKLSPRDVEAAQNLGAIFILQNRLADAEKLNHWVIEQAPRDEDTLENAYFNLGIIYDRQNRQREALDMYKLALQVSPWDAAAYVNAAVILERLGRTAEALAYWEKFARLFPASKRQSEVKKRVAALKKILDEEEPGKKPKQLPAPK